VCLFLCVFVCVAVCVAVRGAVCVAVFCAVCGLWGGVGFVRLFVMVSFDVCTCLF